ncbi:MAG: 50S ribosomal protein L31 [Gammaproteobacteria bacterium]
MQVNIHPEYKVIKATCSCGNVIEVGSTLGRNLNLEVCSECHPFYTGKQKLVDTAGRVEDFYRKYGQKKGQANQATEADK